MAASVTQPTSTHEWVRMMVTVVCTAGMFFFVLSPVFLYSPGAFLYDLGYGLLLAMVADTGQPTPVHKWVPMMAAVVCVALGIFFFLFFVK